MLTRANDNSIYCTTNISWQYPVITEKLAFDILSNKSYFSGKYVYLGIPWATLIDKFNHSDSTHLNSIFNHIVDSEINSKNTHIITVCQHYKFSILTDFLKTLKCKYTLFTPHATSNCDKHIKAFPIFAPISNNTNTTSHRDILYSFVGTYMDHFMSSIRLDIFSLDHPSNTVIVRRDNWHYNQEVYDNQIRKNRVNLVDKYISNQKSKYYERVLSRSIFSLCPSGAGPNSIRLFESMSFGAIPVILSDTLSLPVLSSVDWSECVVQFPEKDISRLPNYLQSLSTKDIENLRDNCYKAYIQLSDNNFTSCIDEYVKYKNIVIQ